jgi:hydrogenase maturation protease
MTRHHPILILGLGNFLMGDEGAGVHFARLLQPESFPPGVDVLDGGTGGFHLTSFFEDYPIVIIIDATLDENPPGTIRLIKPRYAPDFPKAMSTHDIGLKDVIEALTLMDRLPKIYLFVVSIATLQQQQINLSPEIEAALPVLRKKVFALIKDINRSPAS